MTNNPYTNLPQDAQKLASTSLSTVVSEFEPNRSTETNYQSEAQLEDQLIATLGAQGCEHAPIHDEEALLANLRVQVEQLNNVRFADSEWQRLLAEFIAPSTDTILDKTRRIQHEGGVFDFQFDDGERANIKLIDSDNWSRNKLQVINQYKVATSGGSMRHNRYDVTLLLNGLPMVHIELKRRGVELKEAFNQIRRYGRDSFGAGHRLFDYVHIFVISNGTLTKYYSNTTRERQIKGSEGKGNTSNSYEFTMWWADAKNKHITDLTDFARTFLTKYSLVNLITKYCVLDTNNNLLVMRSYQIAATERIINKVASNVNYPKLLGTLDSRGYIWHTTGSGKTLTSFKTAQLLSRMDGVDKVVFVVDRQDLDYQTIKEYDRFAKGAANGNASTKILRENLADDEMPILVTTIQKLNHLVRQPEKLDIYRKHVVFVFDECHRSTFGSMHKAITKRFTKTSMFGFTGTPIFYTKDDAAHARTAKPVQTTESIFGTQLHTYTIVDAIRDGNVLPFKIDFNATMRSKLSDDDDTRVSDIDRTAALESPERTTAIVEYILDQFGQHTLHDSKFRHTVQDYDPKAHREGRETAKTVTNVNGFNAMFAVSSIESAQAFYDEFAAQQAARVTEGKLRDENKLVVATIFSTSTQGEEEIDFDGPLPEEDTSAENLGNEDREFLRGVMNTYNKQFGTSFDIDNRDGFQNYYRDLSQRIKNREVDLVIVVNMFLTGFDATTLNTLYVDKNLRQHGLIQAFSRTNRILNAQKQAGNIVCFRNLKSATEKAIQRFGDSEAYNVVVLESYEHYHSRFVAAVEKLRSLCAPGEMPDTDEAKKNYVETYSEVIRLINFLDMFDEFGQDSTLSKRDFQDYQGVYLEIYEEKRGTSGEEPVDITDDLVFEIELVSHLSVNVDYILSLIAELRDEDGNLSEEDRDRIKREIDSSEKLRLKKDLIDKFIEGQDGDTEPHEFYSLVERECRKDVNNLIESERLKRPEALQVFAKGLADLVVPHSGLLVSEMLPPMRRFGAKKDSDTEKKDRVVGAMNRLVATYGDSVNPTSLLTQM